MPQVKDDSRKQEFIERLKDQSKSPGVIAREMGISRSITYRWVKEMNLWGRARCVAKQDRPKQRIRQKLYIVPRHPYPPRPPWSEEFQNEYDRPITGIN